MRSTQRLLPLVLAATLGIFSTQPVLANCDAAQESCSSSCGSLATSGFIMGMAGALQQNNNAYQTGQRNMQNAQACYSRCQAQFQACSRQEEEARQRAEAQQRAQQQQMEAQRQQRQRQQLALEEREALRKRVNQVISPPVPPIAKIKDASRLLQEAQAHETDSNPAAAKRIYQLVLTGSEQAQHQQAARNALRRHALTELLEPGMRQPAAYAKTLDTYEPLGVFSSAERDKLASMGPDASEPEEAARDYLRKNPKGSLREIAQAVIAAAPGWRAKLAEAQKQKQDQKQKEEEQSRLNALEDMVWVRVNGNCRIFDTDMPRAPDIRWSGQCTEDYASGTGIYEKRDGSGRVLLQYEGSMARGKMQGYGKLLRADGLRFEGDFVDGTRTGQGTTYYPDGRSFRGEYSNNMLLKGVFYGPDGRPLGTLK